MVVTLFPQLHRRDRNPLLYLWVHMLAMTAWAVSMREFPRMAPKYRLSYFVGPVFYALDPDSSLLLTGLVAGTLAYAVERRWRRSRPIEVST